ncbi:ABC transporter ATP-binding protein [Streptococcus oricebi]|uniref:ABC transporter ATP-binding protein n=1 Tax=Streptococcus oricebi TaxID=1547447 RepID=A0ABS5B583_9STRE|nr:ABC transporter ATP-binding protein [Streptococcus oricebi]MBP2624001.1 ABC transporter ATP-binding protein [Streptococcus oricebi]
MINRIQVIFGLTRVGAKNLCRSCLVSFLAFCGQLLPMFVFMFYLQGLLSAKLPAFWLFLLLVLGAVLLLYGVIYWDYNSTYTLTYQESGNIRRDIAQTLQDLPLSYFSNHDLSDLSQTLMSDVERLEHAMSHALAKTLGFLLFFVLMAIFLLLGQPLLGLAILLPILLSAGLLLLSKGLQKRETARYWRQLRENSESFQEAIDLQEEIKAYNLSQHLAQSLYQQMDKSEKIHLRSEIMQGLPVMLSGIILRFSLALLVMVGSLLLARGQVSLLYFIGYLLANIKIIDGVEGIYLNIAEILYTDSAIKRIRDLRAQVAPKGRDFDLTSFDIEVRDLHFSYKKDQEVIKGLSFVARQNEVTALVGPSGCGKTTLLRLISRLYDYQKGQILIGGQELGDLNPGRLFDYISIVFQEVSLFNSSVLENIRLGRPTASDQEVMEAAKKANCQDFIERLPQGYHTLIGENGAKLSGGERQRISIARAILKQAPIVILDEITSSLDIENEKAIQDSLSHLLRDRTVLIISHRLKSIENADQIVVLADGQLDGAGKHQELLASSPVYQELVETAQLIEDFKYHS